MVGLDTCHTSMHTDNDETGVDVQWGEVGEVKEEKVKDKPHVSWNQRKKVMRLSDINKSGWTTPFKINGTGLTVFILKMSSMSACE